MPGTRATASAAEPARAATFAPVASGPLGTAEFAGLMAGLDLPDCPHLAVAVSGGADSLALTRLAADWARARGASLSAFTVDHGLRPESAAEAAQVARWLAAAGIDHAILDPQPALTPGASAAAARAARYAALGAACRRRGIAHLLLAHHRGDQAETVLMRIARGTGLTGAAGMRRQDTRDGLTLCRPLLGIEPARLRATLRQRGQGWIEDPSNADPRAERVRVRQWLAGHADAAAPARWAETIAAPALARLEAELDALAEEAVALHPQGYATLDAAHLADQPPVLVRHLLGRLLTALSGHEHPPRGAALDGALEALLDGRAVTAHGCLLRPRATRMLVIREPAAIAGPARVGDLPERRWDGRFVVAPEVPDDWEIAAAGAADWRKAAADLVAPARRARLDLPGPVRAGLPVFRAAGRIVAVPFATEGEADMLHLAPRNPMRRAGLRVALDPPALI